MPPRRSTKKRNIIEEEEDDSSSSEDGKRGVGANLSSEKAVQDQLDHKAKRMERERATVWKHVLKHEKENKDRVKAIDSQFKEKVNASFAQYKDTELHIDDEIARYMHALAATLGAVQTSTQNILHYLEKRHDGAASTRRDQACKAFNVLVDSQVRLLQDLNAKHTPEQIPAVPVK